MCPNAQYPVGATYVFADERGEWRLKKDLARKPGTRPRREEAGEAALPSRRRQQVRPRRQAATHTWTSLLCFLSPCEGAAHSCAQAGTRTPWEL